MLILIFAYKLGIDRAWKIYTVLQQCALSTFKKIFPAGADPGKNLTVAHHNINGRGHFRWV